MTSVHYSPFLSKSGKSSSSTSSICAPFEHTAGWRKSHWRYDSDHICNSRYAQAILNSASHFIASNEKSAHGDDGKHGSHEGTSLVEQTQYLGGTLIGNHAEGHGRDNSIAH